MDLEFALPDDLSEKTHSELRHPNVTDCIGLYCRDQTEVFIVVEFMDKGDLLKILQDDYELTKSAMITM